MNTAQVFEDFLDNIKIPEDKAKTISSRYARITKTLNKAFRESESETANTLQVGSYGRYTGIKGISDLDMIYIIPDSKWATYNVVDGQRKLLEDVKTALVGTYSTSDIKLDRCVVTVNFGDGHIDIQPAFETADAQFQYPDTYSGGKWEITKPREEMSAMKEANGEKNKNLRRLCKIARAWKNKHGVSMSGLLIDTLAYNFINSTTQYDEGSYRKYDAMCKDFFEYLAKQPKDQKYYMALGSKQQVKVRKPFVKRAKKALVLANEAFEADTDKRKHEKWRDTFGKAFPKYSNIETESKAINESYKNTEEFIEDAFPVDIQYDLVINCHVSQNGYREGLLRDLLGKKMRLSPFKSLKFHVQSIDVPWPYELKWKVTNRGEQAIKRDCIRGQILDDRGHGQRNETTSFKGSHFVECFAVKDGEVVARDFIDVPIST